jgi:hypothetical protein
MLPGIMARRLTIVLLCGGIGATCARTKEPAEAPPAEPPPESEHEEQDDLQMDPDEIPPASQTDAQPEPVQSKAEFRAKVGKVVMLSRFTGTIIPVHPDPRYVLPLTIETAPDGDSVLVRGATINFAIHSPTKLFAGDAPTGRTLDFSVESEVRDGIRRWSGLRVAR